MDDEIARRVRNMRTHGVESTFDPSKWNMLGFNFRYTDIMATIGLSQLEIIGANTDKIKKLADVYDSLLANIPEIKRIGRPNSPNGFFSLYNEFTAERRDDLVYHLSHRGIESRRFYPSISDALYLDSYIPNEVPNSERFFKSGLVLPSGPDHHLEDIQFVCSEIKKFYQIRPAV